MANSKSNPELTSAQAFETVLKHVNGPISVDELVMRYLSIYPSKARNPRKQAVNQIRQLQGDLLVSLDKRTLLPVRLAIQGVRFRVRLVADMDQTGLLPYGEYLRHFVPLHIYQKPELIQLLDHAGQPLPKRMVEQYEARENPFIGKYTAKLTSFDLHSWLGSFELHADDCLLFTVADYERGVLRLDYETADQAQARQDEIDRQDRELADLLFAQLENAMIERIYAYIAVPTAYACMSDPRTYPGHHWMEVAKADQRITCNSDFFMIGYAGQPLSLLDELLETVEREAAGLDDADLDVPSESVSHDLPEEEARKVYRFVAQRGSQLRIVEMQGWHTLADFDSMLRGAFRHDFTDHMGGFWKLVPRGGSTHRYREVELGVVDPFGSGEGADAPIGVLELKMNDRLRYVYDFGDWIAHVLVLESIAEPKPEVEYPRIVRVAPGSQSTKRRMKKAE